MLTSISDDIYNMTNQTVLLITALITISLAQDALIAPKEPYTINYNRSSSLSESHLVEVHHERFMADWASLVAHYHGRTPETIVEVEFTVVYKDNPNRIYQQLNKCRFQDATVRWCKIGSKSPPFNIHHHLLKVQFDCPKQCDTQVLIAMTQTKWDGSYNPNFVGGPISEVNIYSYTKTQALMKIIGWMLVTLLLVLGAIQFAVKVADYFEEKPKKRGRKVQPYTDQKQD